MHKVELLAPAGNVEALHAAVRAGADAVYLGLEEFNARRSAENFTMEALRQACDWAHLRGVRIYVTLNTAVLPAEASRALECARQAWRAGADALIVQDIGLAAELARTLPEARLHASTQMNTHNAAGIRAAARLGASRVTLARELSVEEIAHLAAAAASEGVEVEAFAHGALCVCYSGQCLMSSMIGGRSANRGLCAQACRLPYELRNRALGKRLPAPGDHLLSPQDLCAIDLLPELVRAGVASLKIEGRMKSAEYVHAATSAYRAVLDRVLAAEGQAGPVAEGARQDVPLRLASAPDGGQPASQAEAGAPAAGRAKGHSGMRATPDERRMLSEAFSRGFTTAYLEGQRGNDIMSYQRPNNRGAFIGRVDAVRDGVALVATEYELAEGDVLEFWTGKGHVAQPVAGAHGGGRGRTAVPLDPSARSVHTGDRVFRVRSAAAAFVDDPLEPRLRIKGEVRLVRGQPLRMAFWLADGATAPGIIGAAEGGVVEAARTKAVEAADVRTHVDRLGQTPYALAALDIVLDDGVGIGFSQLHQVRAAALDDLTGQLLAAGGQRRLPRVAEREPQVPARPCGCRIAAWATNPVCARAAKRAGVELVYVPALNYKRGESVIAGQRSDTAEQAGYPKHCIMAMPTIDHDPVSGTREAALGFDPWSFAREDAPLLVDSLGAMQRAAQLGVPFEVGPHVPVTNRLALEAAAELGAARVWLSPELTLAQIAELAQDAPVELGLAIMGAQELMICEHCVLMSQGPCGEECATCSRRKSPHYLKDRKGFEFPVVTDLLGRSHIYNSVPLDVAHALPDLMAAGVSSFMVDTTLMNGDEAACAAARAVRALAVAQRDGNAIAKAPNATSGHLFRGVQ